MTYQVAPILDAAIALIEHLDILSVFENRFPLAWHRSRLHRNGKDPRQRQGNFARADAGPERLPVPIQREQRIHQHRIGKHLKCIFSYRGHRVTQVNTMTWRSTLERVGIGDFRWHKLRHTWASWHVQTGIRCTYCKSWAAGSASRWCESTRIYRAITWRPSWIDCPA